MSSSPNRRRPRRLRGLEPLEPRQLCASDWQNAFNPPDVNNDGQLNARDALAIVQFLRTEGSPRVALPVQRPSNQLFLDVDGNQIADLRDALAVLREARVGNVAPAAAPTGVAAEPLSPGEARITWESNSSVAGYRLAYVKGTATPSLAIAVPVGFGAAFDLKELEPATAYRVALYAQDSRGRVSPPALVTVITRASDVNAPNPLANTTDLDLALRTGILALSNAYDASRNNLPYSAAWTISKSAAENLGDSTPNRPSGIGYQFERHSTSDATGRMLYALTLASQELGTAPPTAATQVYRSFLLQSLFQPIDGNYAHTQPSNQRLVGIPGDTYSRVVQRFDTRYLYNVGGGLRGAYALATAADRNTVTPEYGLSGRQIFEQTIANLRQYYVYDANGAKAYNWERFRQQFNLQGGNDTGANLAAELDADWSDINRTFADPQFILPLVQYYEQTGYQPALALATELRDLSFYQRFPNNPASITAASFSSSYVMAAEMNAYSRLALVLNDADMLSRIRLRYDFVTTQIASDTGWLPETIGLGSDVGDVRATGELIQTALNLAAAGNANYYDDAERFARGLLLPAQVLSPNGIDAALASSVLGMWGYSAPYGQVATQLPSKTGGLFADATASALETITKLRAADYQFRGGAHYVNLLFDHDDARIRIVSPYPTGNNVLITPRVAGDVYFRLPAWALRQPLVDALAAQGLQSEFSGSYLRILQPTVGRTFELPLELVEDSLDSTLNGRAITTVFAGNATVALSSLDTPRPYFSSPVSFDAVPLSAPTNGVQVPGWQEVGGPVADGLVTSDGAGGLYAFALGSSGQVFYRRARNATNPEFGNWLRTPLSATGIDAALSAQGRPLLAAASPTGLRVSELLPSGKWQTVAMLPGGYKSVHFQQRSDGLQQIFALTGSAQLMSASPLATGGWSAPQMAMFNVARFTTIERAPGLFDVFTMTPIGELYSVRQTADGSWSGPELIRSGAYYIEAFGRPDGSETLLTISDNNALWTATRHADGTWTTWQSLGGVLANLTAGMGSDGRIQAFAMLDDGQVWTLKETATGWGDWTETGLFYIRQLSTRKDFFGRLVTTARSQSQSLWVSV